jgi:hypothetical protein
MDYNPFNKSAGSLKSAQVEENYQVQKYTNGKKDGPPKSFGGSLKKATDHASKMKKTGAGDHRVHKEETVLERTESDCEGMVCKSCGDKFGMPTEGSCKYESKDPNGKNWMEKKTEAVSESFLIPEDIPQQERTAFHGAAAAAHKAGKTSFNFGGKKHPVTMKKDAANAIADQKEGIVDKAKMKKDKAEAKGGDKEGDVEMNPKMKKEGMKESRIRSALKSVLSEKKDDHTKNATKAETMDDKLSGKGAKDMMAGAKAEIAKGPDAHLDEPAIDKKNFEGQTKSIPAAKARNAGDNIGSGESKIKPSATPVKDPATTADATDGGFVTNKKKSVKESSMSGPDRNHSIVSAYASMYEAKDTYVFDYKSKEHAKTAAKDFKAGGHTARIRPQHTGGDHALHVTTKKDNHVAIHAIAKKHKSNMRAAEIGVNLDSPEEMHDTTYGHRLEKD